MNGIDTSVLVRALVGDDDEQSLVARELLSETMSRGGKLLVTSFTVAEMAWVLASRYRYGRSEVGRALRKLLTNDTLVFQDVDAVVEALNRLPTTRAGFADILIGIILRNAGCSITWTFDRRAAELDEFALVTPSGIA